MPKQTGSSSEQEVSPRVEALLEAARLISSDRDKQYGEPSVNFGRIAKVWSVLFDREFTSEDVAMAMVGVKLARFAQRSGYHPDTWVDIAGYAGCGYEVGKQTSESSEN